jgi:ABC-type multidrug transport system fused ATPase/permease subunit
MKQYSYVKAIGLSFYSRELYRDVAKNWQASVGVYLAFVLFLAWLPTMFLMQLGLRTAVPYVVTQIIPQLPEITIKDGVVSTPLNQPYYIKDTETKAVLGIIDTSGQYTTLKRVNAEVLLTKTEFFTREQRGLVKTQKIAPTFNLSIKPEQVKEKVLFWAPWLWMILLPLMVFLTFIFRLFQAAVYALLGLFFSYLIKANLSYTSIFKITVVAMTPGIVLGVLAELLGGSLSLGMLSLFVSFMYLFFGIHANKDEK